jgi:hypothetical protein
MWTIRLRVFFIDAIDASVAVSVFAHAFSASLASLASIDFLSILMSPESLMLFSH